MMRTIKGINTAGQSPAPGAWRRLPRQSVYLRYGGALNPSFPHSLDHARASMGAISLRSSIKLIAAALTVMLALTAVCGCKKTEVKHIESHNTVSPFNSFRDIPTVTDEEIAAIEELQKRHDSFSFGISLTTESFLKGNGEIGGFMVLMCDWLTSLFDIRFEPAIYQSTDAINKLTVGDLDFVGLMRITEERTRNYYMTDAISERRYVKVTFPENRSGDQDIPGRPLKYAFMQGFTTSDSIDLIQSYVDFEVVWVGSYDEAYSLLKNGEIDAYLGVNVSEASFDALGEVYTENLYPLIFSAVAMAASNYKLEPIISVVKKAQRNGGSAYMDHLYRKGNHEYRTYKFNILLNDEERAYINNHPVVPVAANFDNYPVCFYNARENEWQGIFFDLLDAISSLTGISFNLVNGNNAGWLIVQEKLMNGEAAFVPDLTRTKEREALFIWPDTPIQDDNYALISKSDHRSVNINEIMHEKVGLARGTAYAAMFNQWFPDHTRAVEYETMDIALNALHSGEVDLVMTTQRRLLLLTHYLELPGYKANLLFDQPIETIFGFNKNEAILCSIIDKALKTLDTKGISEQWMRRTYDYRAKVAEAQRPWLIGATSLAVVVLALVLALFYRSLNEGKRLEKLVAEQTLEVRNASAAKSRFMANMNHEMRTPMNVIVGLTDLMLEEDSTPANIKETLRKINTAGNTLTELINDVLDFSKIEAGKLDLTPVQYDVPSLLNDIITLNLIRIESKPITFKLDINENLPCSLFGDDLRVKQILNNLLSNAFKYTQEGTITLGADCRRESALPDGSALPSGSDSVWLSFYVSDTGIGIRTEDVAKLFTAYNQVDTRANRTIEGTGLGLSITKKFVELMDGEITVESEYGKGTSFRVCIRQGFVTSTPIGQEIVKNLREFHYSDKKKLVHERLVRPNLSYARTLLVDDLPTNLDVAAGMLRKYKMQVDCVTSGQDAVNRISAGEPVYDAIFMDHMMPGMDGMEATNAIRALGSEYAQNIPIIALTANAIAGNEQMFLDHGFNAFLPKPFNALLLDSVVQKWVRDKTKE